jgi:heat shock protein HslJ
MVKNTIFSHRLVSFCLAATIILSLLVCCSCSGKNPLESSAWKVITIDGVEVIEDSYISLYIWNDGTFWGYGGINAYEARWTSTGNNIVFGSDLNYGGITELGGLVILERQEEAYLKALRETTSYAIENNTLVLYDEVGQGRIKLQRLLEHRVNPEKLKKTAWVLESINGTDILPTVRMLLFIDTEGRTWGQAGPVWYEKNYKAIGDDIHFSGGAASRIGASGQEDDTTERALSALTLAGNYNLTIDHLELFSANGDTITFFLSPNTSMSESSIPMISLTKGGTSWPFSFEDMSQLCAYSDLIVMGTGLGFIGMDVSSDNNISTWKSSFRVEAVLKGNIVDKITLGYPISTIQDNTYQTSITNPPIPSGERWVLFLQKNSESIYFEIGPWGRYKITEGKVYSMNRVIGYDNEYSIGKLDVNSQDLRTFIRETASQLRSGCLTFYEESQEIPTMVFQFNKAGLSGNLLVKLWTGLSNTGNVTFTIKRIVGSTSKVELPILAALDVEIEPSHLEINPYQEYSLRIYAKTTIDLSAGNYWFLVECWEKDTVIASQEVVVRINDI